jgi:prohibitin 2
MPDLVVPAPRAEGRCEVFSRRAWNFLRRNSLAVYVVLLSLILAMMLMAPRIFITVPAGHVGVLWLHFFGGTVTDRYYSEGMHIILPWDEMLLYDTRLQNTARTYDTISSNGLAMQVEIAVRYRLDRDSAGLMHKLVGPNYAEVLVYPEIGSHARELIARYTPEQFYTEARAFIQAQMLERMVTQFGSSLISQNVRGKMLHIEDVLIRSVQLPQRVAEAIERKAEQQQMMLEYEFRLAREEKERDRKRIEAEGVRDFQSIVARTITNEYLRLRGIEATTALATSNNSKIIIIGGKDGLPVILNTADTPGAGEQSGGPRKDTPSAITNALPFTKKKDGTATISGASPSQEIPKQNDVTAPAQPTLRERHPPPASLPVKD